MPRGHVVVCLVSTCSPAMSVARTTVVAHGVPDPATCGCVQEGVSGLQASSAQLPAAGWCCFWQPWQCGLQQARGRTCCAVVVGCALAGLVVQHAVRVQADGLRIQQVLEMDAQRVACPWEGAIRLVRVSQAVTHGVGPHSAAPQQALTSDTRTDQPVRAHTQQGLAAGLAPAPSSVRHKAFSAHQQLRG